MPLKIKGHYILIKGRLYQNAVLIAYAPENLASKYIKWKFMGKKGNYKPV